MAPLPLPTGQAAVRGYRAALLIALTAVTVAILLWLGGTIDTLVESGALAQSRTYTDLIIAARAWNSARGGVYVRKSATVQTNPYLIELGVDPDIELPDGTTLTLRNPAAMTREIAEELPLAASGGGFKLTSLDPVNPDNTPDEWERAGLESFASGGDEYWAVAPGESEDSLVFRYMRPLMVDASCLACHGASGYRIGDIRGAISVTLPYAETAAAVETSRARLIMAGVAILVAIWAFIVAGSAWLQRRLAEARADLEHAASTDALTGLWNRGYAFDRLEQELDRARRRKHGLGIILADIDHFKRVNDTHGHAAGDEALRHVARILTETVRTYDLVSRIGGEELLIIAPEIEPSALATLAERVTSAVSATRIDGLSGHSVTLSAGTAYAGPANSVESVDELVARADSAMYAAKQAGRARVVAG
jgi:diguanylate cyclase (GGDEF)-like protein